MPLERHQAEKKRVKLNFIALLLRKDTLATFLLFGVALLLCIWFDGFEQIAAFLGYGEAWHADEFVAAFLLAPFSITFVAVRCLAEAHHELQLRKQAEAKLDQMALHDPLTGLPNRRSAERAISEALRRASGEPFAVLVVDLNRYRAVNDLHGHITGDRLLLETGKRLEQAIGKDGFVGRLGSDEFIMLMPAPTADESLVSRVHAISQVFEEPFELGNLSLHVGASMGVTVVDDDSAGATRVLNHANAAMARCKQRGANGFAFFEPGMELAATQRAEIEAELRSAIASGRITPFYQPLVDLASGEICGFEVLARWRLEDGSLQAPADFIPIAEETGLIGDLFFSLLRTSMEQVKHWPQHYHFAFNLSPIQLGDEWLVERILLTLMQNGVAPGRLDLEITESAIVDDIEKVRGLISRLKAQRFSVTLDDFGTGYSSLRHLSELDFDNLKIDKSFVLNLDTNPASQAIVRSVTALAHSLGLGVCVEGVETDTCARLVRDFGCNTGQGYFFGRPAETLPDLQEFSRPTMRHAAGG